MNDPGKVRAFVSLLSSQPMKGLIRNLSATMEVFEVDGLHLPLSISDPPNCYINAPGTAYIDYAIEETRHFAKTPLLQVPLLGLIRASRPLFRAAGLDHQVQVNNWLFSTNPFPAISEQTARCLRDTLVAQHPTRAIVIRSLNDCLDRSAIGHLTKAGFHLLPARQIYILDPTNRPRLSKDAKADSALLRKSPYHVVDGSAFSAADFARAEALYTLLYIDKYTSLNPHYTADFLRKMAEIGVLTLKGLRGPDGQLDGVIGLFRNGRVLTSPIVGYDTAKPQKLGLYRMLTALSSAAARDKGLIANKSAGAARFKRNRGAEPAIEYTAVYVGHLPRRQRASVGLIQRVLNRIGPPLLRKYGL